METRVDELDLLRRALAELQAGQADLPDFSTADLGEQGGKILLEVARRLQDNPPFGHPLYVGQMLKPPHPLARLAYSLAQHVNPNNHALDGGPASSRMETEAVAEIAAMLGWETHLGHLTSGGTVANFEALWVGRELRPGGVLLASEQAHYTHSRLSAVLSMDYEPVATDARGRMDMTCLRERLAKGDVGTVVATLGTTAAGAVDPLQEIIRLRDEFGFQLHVDAAYGGYFKLVDALEPATRAAYAALPCADSIVIDPHKHGLQPYGCGCVVFKDPGVGRFYQHDSPYTYFSSDELHLGEISLECSRAGAAAVALWATQQLLPLCTDGEFADMLTQCRRGALALHAWLDQDARFAPLFEPELDVVVWAVNAGTSSKASTLARAVYTAAAELDLHLALADFPPKLCSGIELDWDIDRLTCLRACVMKPEHEHWVEAMTERLDRATRTIPRC